ncbi:hypothetical protein OCB72_28975 [Bacillus cereus]|nr:hypothetical protein [Bacillus cereus]
MDVYIIKVEFMNWWKTYRCTSKCIKMEHTVNSVKVFYGLSNNDNALEGNITIPFNVYNEMSYEVLTNYIIKSLDLGKVSEQEEKEQDSKLTFDEKHVHKSYLTAGVIRQGVLKSGYARYKCLCCEHADKLELTIEEHLDVKICPKCNGAFVDCYVYGLHKKRYLKYESQ